MSGTSELKTRIASVTVTHELITSVLAGGTIRPCWVMEEARLPEDAVLIGCRQTARGDVELLFSSDQFAEVEENQEIPSLVMRFQSEYTRLGLLGWLRRVWMRFWFGYEADYWSEYFRRNRK